MANVHAGDQALPSSRLSLKTKSRLWRLGPVLLGFIVLVDAARLAEATETKIPSHDGYFIDFRARAGALLGHNFIVFGRIGSDGRFLDVEYAGNYPADGKIGLIAGSVIPVPTIIGSVRDDFSDPATIIYRRRLNAAQFARVKATVRYIRSTERSWHLLFFNCNDFVVEIARSLGLRSPSPWLLPHAFVRTLRVLNSP